MESRYDFSHFIKSIEDLGFIEAHESTMREFTALEGRALREKRKRGPQQDYQLIEYTDNLHAFLFWFHSGMKPATLSEYNFQLAKPLCKKLIEKGHLKKEALEAFVN